jgi:hypothetical protein
VLAKIGKRVAPPSVKRHVAKQEAERERREQAWRRASGEARRAPPSSPPASPLLRLLLRPIESPDDASEKHDVEACRNLARASRELAAAPSIAPVQRKRPKTVTFAGREYADGLEKRG